MTKECIIELDYLVRIGQSYYCHDTQASCTKDSATRFFSKDAASYIAELNKGEVEVEILTPIVLRTIIIARQHEQNYTPGEEAMMILQTLYNDMELAGIQMDIKSSHLQGENDTEMESLLFHAVGRYADIFVIAWEMIESYYNFMAACEYYDYDLEVDGGGSIEFKANMQVGELYERQILNLALMWYAAKRHLEKAHKAWGVLCMMSFEEHLKCFSNSLIKKRNETNPEKYYKEYLEGSRYLS